jgi:very-short-patch-repair endonuclease
MISFKEKQKTLFKRKETLINNATKSEIEFKQLLDENNIYYIFQKAFIQGNNYVIVDFYLPKLKLCIEIDGGYHLTESQQKRDNNKDYYLIKQRNFKVLRIKNEEVCNFNIKTLQQ